MRIETARRVLELAARLNEQPPVKDRRSASYCAVIALGAAVLGSALGTLVYVGLAVRHSELGSGSGSAITLVMASLLVWLTACVVAIPASLFLGAPLLWLGQGWIVRFPIASSAAIGMIGGVAALAIHHALSQGSIDPAAARWVSVLFGTCVAAVNAVVFYHRRKRLWSRTLLTTISALALAGVGSRALLDSVANNAGGRQYEAECRLGHAIVVLDRVLLTRVEQVLNSGDEFKAVIERGEWHQVDGDPLVRAYSSLSFGGKRVMALNDVAYAPLGLTALLRERRRVERHCLAELRGHQAELARRVGLVRRPPQP